MEASRFRSVVFRISDVGENQKFNKSNCSVLSSKPFRIYMFPLVTTKKGTGVYLMCGLEELETALQGS
jgi:hypothetical protein